MLNKKKDFEKISVDVPLHWYWRNFEKRNCEDMAVMETPYLREQ